MKFIRQHKNKLIAAAVIIILLIISFIAGGNDENNSGSSKTEEIKVTEEASRETAKVKINADGAGIMDGIVPEGGEDTGHGTEHANGGEWYTEAERQREVTEHENTVRESASVGCSQAAGMEADPKTGTDKYNTSAVPEGVPIPAEPQDAEITDTELKCFLTVRCDKVLSNMSRLKPEKISIIPDDGIIYPRREVVFYEGESVFNLFVREMKKNKIHFEYTDTPGYNSAYIEGINNLYEFDCGHNSGWIYTVNNRVPNYGVSRYALSSGDDVVFIYTCDNGKDIESE